MVNNYYNPNYGIQTGSAFMNSMMRSYNESVAMQANIIQYRDTKRMRDKSFALQEETHDMSKKRFDYGQIVATNAAEAELAKAVKWDTDFNDSVKSERTLQKEKALGRIQDLQSGSISSIGTPKTPVSDIAASPEVANWQNNTIDSIGTPAAAGVEPAAIKTIGGSSYSGVQVDNKNVRFVEHKGGLYHTSVDNDGYESADLTKPYTPEKEYLTDLKSPEETQKDVVAEMGTFVSSINNLTPEARSSKSTQNDVMLNAFETAGKKLGFGIGTIKGWDKLGPEKQEMIVREVVKMPFHAEELTPDEAAAFAIRAADIAGQDISEPLMEAYVEAKAKTDPSLWEKYKDWSGGFDVTGSRKFPFFKIKDYKARMTPGEKAGIIEEGVVIVQQALETAGPEVVRAFLGDTRGDDGELISLYSPEAKTILKELGRKMLEKKVEHRERGPGIISQIGDVLLQEDKNPDPFFKQPVKERNLSIIGGKGPTIRGRQIY
jgi:hypothetical protein